MSNYDFHNLLSPPEFEGLVRDILEIREGINFCRGKEGKDGGIDLISSDKKVIVQVKRYQNNYNQLLRSLKSEIIKVQKLNPSRYIIVSSVDYSHKQREEIYDLFKGYIQSLDDIIGKDDLNNYLSKDKFKEIETKHYKLWLSSSNVLQTVLHEEIYRGKLNQSRFKLVDITDPNRIRLYVQNNSFPEALEILAKSNIVVISGQPGIGKTTLAKQLVLYYLTKNSQTHFINIYSSIDEGIAQYDEKISQIFFFDDFWGDVFDERKWSINEDRKFIEFIKVIHNVKNKKLILTTRDYVLSQGIKRYNKIDETFSLIKYTIDPAKYTKLIKGRILLNHLYFSSLSNEVVNYFIERGKYFSIIKHANYSPRLIEKFIQIAVDKDYHKYEFDNRFEEYLDNPYQYWEDEIFRNQTSASKLILLLLLISNTPILLNSLFESFKQLVKYSVKYGFNVSLEEFKSSIKTLEDSIIVSNPYFDTYKIEFQNPSIKDFLLEYLRKNIDIYGELLIRSATFFNQLIFVFTTDTDDKEILDDDADNPLYGNKIVLNEGLNHTLRLKLLQEFDQLHYSEIEEKEYAGFTIWHDKKDTLVWKLVQLHRLFDISIYLDVRSFIIQKIQTIIDSYSGEGKMLAKDNMDNLPELIKIITPYFNLDKVDFIKKYYSSITFTSEFLSFADLHAIFPVEYQDFVNNNIREIRRKVKEIVLDDADYYAGEIDNIKLAHLLDYEYQEVFKMFGLKVSKKFTDKLYEYAGIDRYPTTGRIVNSKKYEEIINFRKEEKATKKAIKKEFETIFKTEEELYFGAEKDEATEIIEYIQREVPNSKSAHNIIEELTKNEFSYFGLTDTPAELDLIIDYFKEYHILPTDEHQFFAGLLEIYASQAAKATNVSSLKIISFLEKLAFRSYLENKKSFNEQYVINLPLKVIDDEIAIIVINELSPLLINRRNWFNFNIYRFHEFLAASYISKLQIAEKVHFYKNQLLKLYDEKGPDIEYLWKFCLALDPNYYNASFVLPQLHDLIKIIDDSTDRQLCRTLFQVFDIEFYFEYNKEEKGLTMDAASSSNSHWSDLLNFLQIPLDMFMLDLYFYGKPHGDYIGDIPITKSILIHKKVRKYLRENCTKVNEWGKTEFQVNMAKFEKNDYAFKLMKELEMVEYITTGYSVLKKTVRELEIKYLISNN